MEAGALFKYLFSIFRNFVEKCMYSSHNMKTRRQEKAIFHYAKTSELTEYSIEYKACKLKKMPKAIGLWPVVIDQERIKMLHRFYRHLLNLYLNDKIDVFAFLSKLFFLLKDQLIFMFNQ